MVVLNKTVRYSVLHGLKKSTINPKNFYRQPSCSSVADMHNVNQTMQPLAEKFFSKTFTARSPKYGHFNKSHSGLVVNQSEAEDYLCRHLIEETLSM